MSYDVVLFTDSLVGVWRPRSLGAYRIASELRKHGYSVKVIDWTGHIFSNYKLALRIFRKVIGSNTFLVGFSGSHFHATKPTTLRFKRYDNYQSDLGHRPHPYPGEEYQFDMMVDQMRKLNPTLKIVYGGSWATVDMKFSSKIDYIIPGYADNSIIELVNHLLHGANLKFMPGHHPKQKIINHDALGLNFNFSESWTKFEPEDHIRHGEVMSLETSRGCMFKCSFCTFVLLGRKTTDPKYHKEIDVLSKELKYNWENFGIHRYYIMDDTFNESTGKLKAIHEAVKKSGVPDFQFFAYMRIDLLKKWPEQIPLLKEMGLQSVYFGIESFNDATLKDIGKPMKSAEVKEFLKELKEAWGDSILLYGSFIFGLPYETPETATEWAKWLFTDENVLDSASIAALELDPLIPTVIGDNPEARGYKLKKEQSLDGPYWTWENQYWTKDQATVLSRKFNEGLNLSRKNKQFSWEILGLQDLGYDFEFIKSTACIDYNRLEIRARLEKQRDDYIDTLCKYEGIVDL